MKLDELGLDRIKTLGLPYHGLWKDGSITLPNDETKACTAPTSGACVLIKVPAQAAVTRTTEEADADTAAGREWRNYGLISGGRYGGSNVLYTDNAATVFYIDSTKKRWLVRIEKNSSTTDAFFFKVRRFGHIDGTTQDWSAAVALSFPTVFWTQVWNVNKLVTIAQNSTGSESIIGNTVALLKITISGDVDLDETGFGLTISHDLLEYDGRLCVSQVAQTTVSGVFTETSVYHYEQIDNSTSLPTGITYDREIIWTDGTVTSDDGAPTPVSGFTWAPTGQDDTFSSSKTKTVVISSVGTKYMGAGYYVDVLKLIGHEYSYVITETTTWTPNYDVYHWIYQHVSTQSVTSLKSKINSTVVNNQQVTSPTSSLGSGPLGPDRMTTPLPANMLDGYENTSTTSLVAWGSLGPWEYFEVSGVGYHRGVYFRYLVSPTNGWKNPVVALITQTRPAGYGQAYDVYTTASVHAPSLATVETTTHIDNLFASWQPQTNELAVDTQNICWF